MPQFAHVLYVVAGAGLPHWFYRHGMVLPRFRLLLSMFAFGSSVQWGWAPPGRLCGDGSILLAISRLLTCHVIVALIDTAKLSKHTFCGCFGCLRVVLRKRGRHECYKHAVDSRDSVEIILRKPCKGNSTSSSFLVAYRRPYSTLSVTITLHT